jgi:phosphatidylserine/phosphatidylglycerophosphate/cardiolipin synthase-like enzyme
MVNKIGTQATSAVDAASKTSSNPKLQLLDNQNFGPALEKLLSNDGSKSPVYMIQYNFFTDDGSANPSLNASGLPTQIMNELKALGDSGVKVNALLEGDHSDSIQQRNGFTQKQLQGAKNIDVTMNDSKSNGFIDHAKMVVRGNTVIAGSHNLTQTSMTKNNEVSLEVTSPKIAAAAKQYIQACSDPSTAGKAQPMTVTDGNTTMITDTAYQPQLLNMINSCQKGDTLTGSMYDFDFNSKDASAKSVMDALVAAEKRGVKVTMLLDHEASQGTNAEDNNAAAAAYLKKNAPADNQPNVVLGADDKISHQKFLIKNGSQVLMGSTNWTDSDFNNRHQVNWLVNDSSLASSLQTTLLSELKSPSNTPSSSSSSSTKSSRDVDAFEDSPSTRRS